MFLCGLILVFNKIPSNKEVRPNMIETYHADHPPLTMSATLSWTSQYTFSVCIRLRSHAAFGLFARKRLALGG